MPEIEIRPAQKSDLPALVNLDARYETTHVWQLERAIDDNQVAVSFRLARLPRSVKVDYPRSPALITPEWLSQSMVLAAIYAGNVVGYVRLSEKIAQNTIWITDLVVNDRLRRQGIATVLVLAAQDWGASRNIKRISIEMQSKNYPAIQLSHKLGYEFSGYIDHYYPNHDIAIIFSGIIR